MKSNSLCVLLLAISINCCFAQGYYLEYKMSLQGRDGAGGISKTYYQDGNTRTEVNITTGNYAKTLATLILKANPDKVYLLNLDQKTYDETDISKKPEMNDTKQADYQVTVLGKEKVNGYNCVHAKVLNLKDSGQIEYWTSTEVAGYSDYMSIKTKYTGKENLNKALAAKGAAGFPVRVVAAERMGSFQLDLVKAAKQSNPASLFSLDGFTKNTSSGTQSSAPANQQEMMQKLQNMSPEERQKYIQQLMQLQQQNQPH